MGALGGLAGGVLGGLASGGERWVPVEARRAAAGTR